MSESSRPPVEKEATPKSLPARLIQRSRERRRAKVDVAIIENSGLFDRHWYLQQYPDVAAAGMDPLLHYVLRGVQEGRNPTADFDTRFYLEKYPKVAASDMHPFRHYVEFGKAEGRQSCSHNGIKRATSIEQKRAQRATATLKIIRDSGLFDASSYLDRYPSVGTSGLDPVVHYVERGASELKNPCEFFDTAYYLKNNPDVAAADTNPLYHFLVYGWKELRDPSPEFNITWYWLTQQAQDRLDGNPLVHYVLQLENERPDPIVRPAGMLQSDDQQLLVTICEQILSEQNDSAEVASRLGRALVSLSRWDLAEDAFRKVIELDWNNAKTHFRLADTLIRQGRWWQAVQSLEHATGLDPTRGHWLYRLGDAQEKMNRYALAADSFRRAIDVDPQQADWYYRLGYAYEKSDRVRESEQVYAEALERDERNDVKRFGVGMLHQLRGYWPEAAEAYARDLKSNPFNAELHYNLGMAQDRCYRWREAEQAYWTAIALRPDTSYWHYRYGFVLERQGRLREAAKAYAEASALSPIRRPYWYYRCAYVLEQAGEYEKACLAYIQTHENQALSGGRYHPEPREPVVAAPGESRAFLEAINGNLEFAATPERDRDWARQRLDAYLEQLPGEEDLVTRAIARNATNPHFHYRLGEAREKAGEWNGAAAAYADAVARSNPHRPAWYYRLGFVLFRENRFEQACQAFHETRILRRPFGVDLARYQKDPEQKMLMEYNEYLETLSIRDKHVLYESMHGTSVGGNPYAIFKHLLDDPAYDGWIHVWVLAEGIDAPAHLRSHRNILFVERQSDLYRRYLATASHLINDVTFPYWFIRRPEQKYLNTWHGTPLKKLGKDIPGEFMAHGNVQRNLLQTTHLISPNQHTSDVVLNSYDVGGIIGAKLAETGYPRIDRMLKATPEHCERIRGKLGLVSGMPVVLYAPTWRGEHGRAEFNIERLQADIAALVHLPCQIVFRGHHMVEEMLEGLSLPVVIAGQDVDTSDVLAITDILITDYSSIFFDFLPLQRPIFHYCYDWDDYAKKRGLYLDIHAMPGRVCEDLAALVAGLSEQLVRGAVSPSGHADALAHFCPHEDGAASARVADFFFRGDDRHVIGRDADPRRSLLFFAGVFPPNGITSSFLNLIKGLVDLGHDRLSIVLDADKISAEPTWKQKFDELPVEVGCLPRVGRMVQSPEECWVGEKFSARRNFPSEAMWDVICAAYTRERTRLLGSARIDTFVNFEGYSGFWTATLGMGASSMKNISYLHNDMVEEYRAKHPYLASLFGMYRYYDRLVSVSEHMSEVNREKMAAAFDLPADIFTSCINTINVEEIRQRAEEPLDDDLVPWLEAPHCFLTMGRMSPEKDHAKLVEAFAQVHAERSDTRLVILGDGPLRHALEARIAELGLKDAIYLAGLRKNPFPALSRCSCFVLPSNHEGQPMVLLEAMTLRRHIIATDIDGNRGVLGDQYGRLVHNSAKGLASGMRELLSARTAQRNFDAGAYQAMALAAFRDTVAEPMSG